MGCFLLVAGGAFSQRMHLGIFGGLANYEGDLVDKAFAAKQTHGSIGMSLNYELTDKIILRGGFTFGKVSGSDAYSKDPALRARNLSFKTGISEFSLVVEYYLNNLYDRKYSPYIFGGLAVYHFNPYTYDSLNNKVFLKPLSTEGEGLAGYPKPYSLTQLAIPFGGGIKFAITNNIRIGLELGMRKLFTDYLDDVSSNYADPAALLVAKGQQAVDLSYRGDEIPGGDPNYPTKGSQRGGAKYKDWYYFTGLHLTFRLGGGNIFAGKYSKYGCPKPPM